MSIVLAALAVVCFAWAPANAYAGRSATGELAFHPCTRCHPVTTLPDGTLSHPLPGGFKKHEIVLEKHDILGVGEAACLACHDDPSRNPGKLILPDGSLVDITGAISRVCQRCHFEKYRQWETGVHGKGAPKCSAAGCHDPHTPSWIYVPALPPFQGTGMEVRAVSQREPFTPMASPPVAPDVLTPFWLLVLALSGAVLALALVGYLTLGRSKR